MKVGFIGIGNMGGAMASWLPKKGHTLVVHDLNKEIAKPLIELGATWADSPKELAKQSEVICSMLPGPIEMERVTLGENGILEGIQPNAIYVDHTTNSPELVKKVGKLISSKQAQMLDAPVMGDRMSINEGVLTIYVGGELKSFKKVQTILEAMANQVLHVGTLGNGSITKVALNALAMSIDLLTTECFTLAVKSGVKLPDLLNAVDRAEIFGKNASLKRRLPGTLFKGKFLPSRFFLRLAYKDYRLFHELMTLNKVPARLVSMCEMEMLEAINNGWEDQERVISSTLQEKRSNVELRTED